MDKSWDAMHRCLTDGSLNGSGVYPFDLCVFGGKQLHNPKDCIISFKSADEVKDLAVKLPVVDRREFRDHYFKMHDDYLHRSEIDFEYTWDVLTD